MSLVKNDWQCGWHFQCRHRGREHWWAGYLRLKIAVLTARAGLTSCLFQACTVSQFGWRVHQHGRKFTVDSKNSQNQHVTRPKTPLAKSETENQQITGVYNPGRNSQKGRILRFQGLPSANHRSLQPRKKFPQGKNFTVSGSLYHRLAKTKWANTDVIRAGAAEVIPVIRLSLNCQCCTTAKSQTKESDLHGTF